MFKNLGIALLLGAAAFIVSIVIGAGLGGLNPMDTGFNARWSSFLFLGRAFQGVVLAGILTAIMLRTFAQTKSHVALWTLGLTTILALVFPTPILMLPRLFSEPLLFSYALITALAAALLWLVYRPGLPELRQRLTRSWNELAHP
jgi:hypothetical protein